MTVELAAGAGCLVGIAKQPVGASRIIGLMLLIAGVILVVRK